MRGIAEKFEDKEFELILKAKEKSGLSWHDFILKAAKRELNEQKEV